MFVISYIYVFLPLSLHKIREFGALEDEKEIQMFKQDIHVDP